MPRPTTEWKVLTHGPLEQIDEGILAVVGDVSMPLVDLPRRMTVVRLRDGGLVIWSAVSLDDAGMATLESFGRLAFLVVPGDHHRLDAAAWKARFPALHVVAPLGARDTVAEVVPVDTVAPAFGDPDVQFGAVPGTRDKEAFLLVHRSTGTTLVLSDLVANIRHASGFGGWLLKAMGFAGDAAQIPAITSLAIVKDKAALRTQLLHWAEIADLKRIVVAHGELIDDDPRTVLRELAGTLA